MSTSEGRQRNGSSLDVATVSTDPLPGGPRGRPGRRTWVAPVVAAAALVGVTVAVGIASQRDGHPPAPAAGNGPVSGSILGLWRLVAADDGHAIQVPATPAVRIAFQPDGTAVVGTGVNAITLTVRYEQGAVMAQFHGTTAVYDGNTDPNYRAVLGLLDALAPMAGPAPAVRSTYRVEGDRLTIRVSSGTLEFSRDPAGGPPAGSGAANSSPAAPAGLRPS